MQLTKATEYAISSLLRMAKGGKDDIFLVRDIASEEGISREFLAKIFQVLAKKGVLNSKRGNRGGFCLAKPAHQISLRDVLEALDGPLKRHECARSEFCHRSPCSSFHKLLGDMHHRMEGMLDNTSIASLVAGDNFV